MNITLENPEESRDFGSAPTIKIVAFDPTELFQLGRISCRLETLKAEFVIGTTADGTGKYMRLPLVCSKLP